MKDIARISPHGQLKVIKESYAERKWESKVHGWRKTCSKWKNWIDEDGMGKNKTEEWKRFPKSFNGSMDTIDVYFLKEEMGVIGQLRHKENPLAFLCHKLIFYSILFYSIL